MLRKTDENYKWYALSCTTLGAFLSILNSSTLVVALPVIARELKAPPGIIVWILMVYMLSITVFVPTIGRITDIIGRKKLYVVGFALFTFSSLLCGLAQNGGGLIIARFLQSLGGSLILANSTTIVADAFPSWQLGRALGINGMVISAGAVIGPVIGGLLTTINWRWVFFFNLPFGTIGTIWAAIQLKEVVKLPKNQRLDWLGTILFTSGFAIILLALTIGFTTGWSASMIILYLIFGFLLLFAFIVVENRSNQPMLDLSLFRRRLLAAAYTSNFLNGVARGAVTFLMVFFFQIVRNIDPLQAGILMIPFAAAMMIVAPISGFLSDSYGSRELSSLGLAISAAGLFGLTRLQVDTNIGIIMVYMIVMGVGSGLFFSPNTNAIMSAVAPERRGIAAGIRTMMNNAGSVVSIALSLAMTASCMSQEALEGLFTGTGFASQGIVTVEFITGLHHTFMFSFIISLIATIIALMRGSIKQITTPVNE